MVILRKNKHNKSYKKENYYIFNSNNRNKIFENNPQSKEIAYKTEIIFVSYTWIRWLIFKIYKEIILGVESLNQGRMWGNHRDGGRLNQKIGAWEYKGNQGVGGRLSQRIGMYGKSYVNPLACKLVSKLKLKIDFEKNYPSWIDSATPRRHGLLSKKKIPMQGMGNLHKSY